MPKYYICRSLREWRTFFFCQDEAEMQRQGERSLICFLFISGALWQTAELLFYAVRLCRPCQDSLKTTHFLFRNVCLMASVSEVSFESNFVACLLWFHFIWNLAEEELWMKTSLVVYSSLYTEEIEYELIMTPREIEYELIMTPWEINTLETEILMCFNILYYDTIYFYCISLPLFIELWHNLYWCSLILVQMVM